MQRTKNLDFHANTTVRDELKNSHGQNHLQNAGTHSAKPFSRHSHLFLNHKTLVQRMPSSYMRNFPPLHSEIWRSFSFEKEGIRSQTVIISCFQTDLMSSEVSLVAKR